MRTQLRQAKDFGVGPTQGLVGKTDPQAPSLWLSGVPRGESPVLSGSVHADFAIIGGGLSGLATAYFLKRAEPAARVVVLDAGRVAHGATGRAGGFVTTEFGLSLAATVRAFGQGCAREARQYTEHAVELVERIVRQNHLDCGWERVGLLRVATAASHVRRVQDEVALAQRVGASGVEWLEAGAVREQLDGPHFHGASWEPRAGLLDPARLAQGLREVLEAAGVTFFEGTPVTRIERKIGRIFVRTPRGGVLAEKVAVTTNAYSSAIQGLRRKQASVMVHVVASEPLSPRQRAGLGWKGRQALADAQHLSRFYRLTPDNRLLVGCRDVALGAVELSARTFGRLEAEARALFPSLGALRFPHRWGGPISVPVQLVPALGFLGGERVAYSLGCMGHGIALAHLNGWTLSDLLRGERSERTEVFFVNRRVLPWPPGPVQQLLALAVRALVKADDTWAGVSGAVGAAPRRLLRRVVGEASGEG